MYTGSLGDDGESSVLGQLRGNGYGWGKNVQTLT